MLTAIAAATGLDEGQALALLLVVVAPALACLLTLAYDALVGRIVLDAPDALETGEIR